MNHFNLKKHISGQFNDELESVLVQITIMGNIVEQQLSNAITAMYDQENKLAKYVIKQDHKVNMMEIIIDEACVRIIAKRQPIASDLRLIIAIIKISTELERIGDVADKICRIALEKSSYHQHQLFLMHLKSLGHRTVKMLHDVLNAFSCMDLNEAIRIYQEDKYVDKEYESIVHQMISYMIQNSKAVPSILTALLCARSIERIGDRCQNICEYIFYFIKGKDFRHVNGNELNALLLKK